tara:strand:- start:23139 stop:23339 length:201 start_codon:yes stop_codon:yes gene_type:complete
MRKKFKILYPKDHPEKAGQRYKPKGKDMVVMNSGGVFFLFGGDDYYSSIQPLKNVLPKYDVVWNDE